MTAGEMPYFKFVSDLIDSGVWARMSPAARTLYPVLLRFSDRNFKPVYPGTRLLLQLTGFKQKSSLRKARKELVDAGLLTLATGSGRRNTCYHFRFDIERGTEIPLWGIRKKHPPEPGGVPVGASEAAPGVAVESPPYNNIQITISNHVPEPATERSDAGLADLRKRFGARAVELAISECALSGQEPGRENLVRILEGGAETPAASWTQICEILQARISPGSLGTIRGAFLGEREGLLVFSDRLPVHLQAVLERVCEHVFFEPTGATPAQTRRNFWKQAGGNR